jgi:GlpG protein
MRLIGHIQGESAAATFSDFLQVQGIKNDIETETDGRWAVWVHAEDELEHARQLLAHYHKNPQDPRFRQAADQARVLREKEDQEHEQARKRVYDRTRLFPQQSVYGWARLTLGLVALSVVVSLFSNFGANQRVIVDLLIAAPGGNPGLSEIQSGQLWRIWTPIFIHLGFVHLLFNMLWLFDLGNMIETRLGTAKLALLVAVIGAVSNLGQYWVSSAGGAFGGNFGGMSGVVYGLLGYVWIRGKLDVTCGLFLHPTIVVLMIVWFFLGLSGAIEHIANTAHGVGLVMGMAWGYTEAQKAAN